VDTFTQTAQEGLINDGMITISQSAENLVGELKGSSELTR
jgi:hypothetical protein